MPARGLLSHGKDLEAYIYRLPQWPRGKESTCNAGYAGSSIPGSGRSPREGHGYPLQYSCLENSMVRGAWCAIVHGVAKSQTQLKRLSTHTHTHVYIYTHTLYMHISLLCICLYMIHMFVYTYTFSDSSPL